MRGPLRACITFASLTSGGRHEGLAERAAEWRACMPLVCTNPQGAILLLRCLGMCVVPAAVGEGRGAHAVPDVAGSTRG